MTRLQDKAYNCSVWKFLLFLLKSIKPEPDYGFKYNYDIQSDVANLEMTRQSLQLFCMKILLFLLKLIKAWIGFSL